MKIDALIVSGFSGSGKGTLINRLISSHPDFELIKSRTTRNRRNESDYYVFDSVEEFLRAKEEQLFLECNYYSGEWYGTPKSSVEKCIAEGRVAVIEVDPNGYMQIANSDFSKRINMLSVFIVADADTIINRLLQRNTESLEKILKRIRTSVTECEYISLYDYVLPNYDLDYSIKLLEDVVLVGSVLDTDFDIDRYKNRMKHIIWLLDEK